MRHRVRNNQPLMDDKVQLQSSLSLKPNLYYTENNKYVTLVIGNLQLELKTAFCEKVAKVVKDTKQECLVNGLPMKLSKLAVEKTNTKQRSQFKIIT